MSRSLRAGLVSVVYLSSVHLVAFAGTVTVLAHPRGMVDAEGWALDEAGTTVVGFAANSEGVPFPARWKNRHPTVLDGPVVGTETGGPETAHPLAWGLGVGISGDGEVVAQVGISDTDSYAAIWDDHARVWRALPRPFPGLPCGARAVSSTGEVAGGCAGHTVLWQDGQPTVLPPLDANDGCFAYAVNDAGQAAGLCFTGGMTSQGSPSVAVRWTDGVPEHLWGNPQDFDSAYGRGINSAGTVVGTQRQAALEWSPGDAKPVELAPVGVANGINTAGDATGYIGVNGGEATATVWRADGSVVSLGRLPGGTFSWGRAINDAGTVTGMADAVDGHEYAVLFTP